MDRVEAEVLAASALFVWATRELGWWLAAATVRRPRLLWPSLAASFALVALAGALAFTGLAQRQGWSDDWRLVTRDVILGIVALALLAQTAWRWGREKE